MSVGYPQTTATRRIGEVRKGGQLWDFLVLRTQNPIYTPCKTSLKEDRMGKAFILWLLGVPGILIILLWFSGILR
jgi:hypothetical protein